MAFISLTRLRVRSIRFLPSFILNAIRSSRQAGRAKGFQTGALLADRAWAFWTVTAWDSQDDMRRFMNSGTHKKVMPYLLNWCDEASVAHWEQRESALPTWTEADRRMRQDGRASKVRYPSAQHGTLSYREPRTTFSAPIRRA